MLCYKKELYHDTTREVVNFLEKNIFKIFEDRIRKERQNHTTTGMDESHNIVLPYSWPKPTTLSGEPIKGTVQRIFHTKVLTFSYEILKFTSKILSRAASEYSA